MVYDINSFFKYVELLYEFCVVYVAGFWYRFEYVHNHGKNHGGPSAIFWLIGEIIAQALVTLIAFTYFKNIIRNKFDFTAACKKITKEGLGNVSAFAFPLGIATFFMVAKSVVQNDHWR